MYIRATPKIHVIYLMEKLSFSWCDDMNKACAIKDANIAHIKGPKWCMEFDLEE